MDAKIIAGILAAGGAALAAGGVYRMNKKTGYFKKGNSVRYDVICGPQQCVRGVHSEKRQLYLHQRSGQWNNTD